MPLATRDLLPAVGLLACAALCSVISGCGLFQSEPQLPTVEEVTAARERQAGQWERLERCIRWLEQDPVAGWDRIEELRVRFPDDARLALLIQDLQIQANGIESVRAMASRRWAEQPTALHALLAAKVTVDREVQAELVERALELDGTLEQAALAQIALEARAGQPEVLERLIRLLDRYPGLAEGWRLLGELAPLYARPDLALRAEETEPWSRSEAPRRSLLALAEVQLASGSPERALELLQTLPAEDAEATIIRAAAHAAANRPAEARTLLSGLVKRDPQNAVVHFNLGLLYRDYLPNPALSAHHLQRYLDTADLPAEQDLLRRIQVEFWLSEYRSGAAAAGAEIP
jgi:predicted Zn-dependent protease